jgi:hypothetical protein
MARGKTICNVCGKKFNMLDDQENFGIHTDEIGYGSRYDGKQINLDMCCKCFDKLMSEIIPKCKINPIEEHTSYGDDDEDLPEAPPIQMVTETFSGLRVNGKEVY